jgi:hypothetical protein
MSAITLSSGVTKNKRKRKKENKINGIAQRENLWRIDMKSVENNHSGGIVMAMANVASGLVKWPAEIIMQRKYAISVSSRQPSIYFQR